MIVKWFKDENEFSLFVNDLLMGNRVLVVDKQLERVEYYYFTPFFNPYYVTFTKYTKTCADK